VGFCSWIVGWRGKRLTPEREYLIDLSFALGVPIDTLRTMSAVDLELYQQYTAKRMFPGRRVELLLAQIAHAVAVTMGGATNTKLSDYLFDPEPEAQDKPQLTVEEIRAMHGFNPIKRRKPAP